MTAPSCSSRPSSSAPPLPPGSPWAAGADPFSLAGRHVLVTGASGGIGAATALVVARLGGRVALNGRDSARLAAVLATLPGEGHSLHPFDLTAFDAVPEWLKSLTATAGPLDGLAHCAGLQASRPVRSVDLAFFQTMLSLNLGSAFALARGLRQKGCHAGPAAVVLVASVAAFIGQPGNSVYAAAKGGLLSATRALAMELLRDGLRVNAVAPALIDTPMAERFRRTLSAEQEQAILARHPMGLGTPEDVALAIAFLLAPASRWITGVTLPVDGGHMAR